MSKRMVTLLVIIVADSLFTVYLVTIGHGEANPILDWYMQYVGVVGMAVTKIVISTALLILVTFLEEEEKIKKYLGWAIKCYLLIFTSCLGIQFLL